MKELIDKIRVVVKNQSRDLKKIAENQRRMKSKIDLIESQISGIKFKLDNKGNTKDTFKDLFGGGF